jgi:hypothetical protein
LAAAIAGLAWTPIRGEDGAPAAWPDDVWPLHLAAVDTPSWTRSAARWTAAVDVGFRPYGRDDAGAAPRVALTRIEDADAWTARIGDASVVAFTLVEGADGVLSGAEVVLNAARYRFAEPPERDAYGLDAVLTHELGHVLGLGHSCGEDVEVGCFGLSEDDPRRTATMRAGVEPGAEPVEPGPDDIAGAGSVTPERVVRRLRLEGVSAEGLGRWRVALAGLRPGDDLRVWRGGARVEAEVEVAEGVATVGVDSPDGPLDLEAWSAAGQGLWLPAALTAARPDAAVAAGPDAHLAEDTGVDAPDAGRTAGRSGGCFAAPPGADRLPCWPMFPVALGGLALCARTALRRRSR